MANQSRSLKHIAQALSLAQRELENLPARHDGQIRRPLSKGVSLLEPYRYVSLGDGLALIRPVLGRHGLSVIQSTQSDAALGLLILQTRLIHESGEWISSDYPVTRLDGLHPDDPRQTGAALTYARRQSLFALIGIAGQADTDGVATVTSGPPPAAPIQGVAVLPGPDAPVSGASSDPSTTDSATTTMSSVPYVRDARRRAGVREIAPDRSTALAQRLTADLALLSSDEDRRQWAIGNVSAMRELMPEDRASLNRLFVAAISPRVEELPAGASAASASVAPAAPREQDAHRGPPVSACLELAVAGISREVRPAPRLRLPRPIRGRCRRSRNRPKP